MQPRRFLVCFERLGERELVDPGIGARHGIGRGSQSRVLDETELIDPGVDARRGSGKEVSSSVRELTDPSVDARRGIG